MPHHWIPNSTYEIRKKMLEYIGVKDVLDLFNDVPSKLILKEPLKVGYGRPLTEYEVKRVFNNIISKNKLPHIPSFIGGGVCYHHVPSVVKAILSRSEFYTAYTPYQPEIAQGLLQAFFEYQSIMAELYGVDVVNASMYNGSTAAAEAVLMASRVTKRKKVLVSRTVHPEIRDVIKTWCFGAGLDVVEVNYDVSTGETSLEDFENKLNNDVAAFLIQSPNFFGVIETKLKKFIDTVHNVGALAIVYSNPIALGVFEAPGALGADIVVGDTQALGNGLNYGGPSAGILGIKEDRELLRQLPGRLIGMTKTVDGVEKGFMMILQTREQHIRRERATSNITTNSALEAIASAVYISLLGAEGLRRLGEAILGRTEYLIRKLRSVKDVIAPLFAHGVYFREVPFKVVGKDLKEVLSKLIHEGIYVGPQLDRFYSELSNCSLTCVTEVHTLEDIDMLVSKLSEALGGG